MRALLIQKSIKPWASQIPNDTPFESFVNSEEYQTKSTATEVTYEFESFVNSEEYQTLSTCILEPPLFESFVNSEEYQTSRCSFVTSSSLRALLIQKSIKLSNVVA